MDKGVNFSEEELNLKRFRRTAFYQTVFYPKLEDVIIDKEYRLAKACTHLGDSWRMVQQYLSTEQKQGLNELVKMYGRSRRRKTLRHIATHSRGQAS